MCLVWTLNWEQSKTTAQTIFLAPYWSDRERGRDWKYVNPEKHVSLFHTLPVFDKEKLSLDILFPLNTLLHGLHVRFYVLLMTLEVTACREGGEKCSAQSQNHWGQYCLTLALIWTLFPLLGVEGPGEGFAAHITIVRSVVVDLYKLMSMNGLNSLRLLRDDIIMTSQCNCLSFDNRN